MQAQLILRRLPMTIDQILANFKPEGDCLIWQGAIGTHGYGVANLNGVVETVHRIVYKHFEGFVTEGLQVLHKCNRKPCGNIYHLYEGTHQENCDDRKNAGTQVNPPTGKGEACPHASLTNVEVLAIRELYREGGWTQLDLAKAFGISREGISGIITRRTWSHL